MQNYIQFKQRVYRLLLHKTKVKCSADAKRAQATHAGKPNHTHTELSSHYTMAADGGIRPHSGAFKTITENQNI